MEQKTVTVSLGKVFKWLGLVILVGIIVFIFLASQSGFNGGFYNTFDFIFRLIKMSFPIVTLVFAVTFGRQLIKSFTSKTPEEKHTHTSKLIKVFIAILIWFLLFAGLTILNNAMGVNVGDDVSSDEITAVSFDGGGSSILKSPLRENFYPDMFNQNGSGSIADTREFMKVSYSGNIKTRDVKDTTRDVRGIIRDMDGRVDSENVSEKYGYVNFVIPKSNFDDFRDEIESITHKKLYIENTSSQNLLNQKQNIEQNMDLTNKSLSDLQSEKTKSETAHNKSLASLQAQLKSLTTSAETMRAKLDAMPAAEEGSPEQVQARMTQESYINFSNQVAELKNKIAQENRVFTENKKSFDSAIGQFNNQLGEIKKDDKAFADNIETVNGSVSIQWVNLWQLAQIFSPIHPILIIIILLIIIWYILRRKNKVPMFVFKW